ncbi:hypothetical protein CC1G_07861 [Coprinopsis cinerea okayama7|uniref:Uncharacterized protein n=1 Tax=Coprinopsis cinerea (strain Okayama-7 / 130 / ATCC MYA-4618 / FGSC 9003) TaxID=240176 RepID=A8P436_COPC7|nr:hypothetical protein CC1G_07861 [Coprinopsis cinerea okayama7\|eukprot:XP_001838670.2 hypothetical protein CC1G_07861 [Coprinopsis cinerea okayama7\
MQPGSSSNDGLTAEELGRLLEWVVQKSPSPAFKGLSKDLPPWFLVVEEAAQSAKIPLQKRADIAIYLLKSQELKDFMQGRKALYREISGRKHWNWDDFKQDIKGIMAAAHAHAQGGQGSGSTFLRAAGTVLAIGGATVLFPAVGILGLNALGFGAGGVVGGSIAATIQSIFYGGATTGLFSILQSIGATAAAPTVGSMIASASAVGAGAVMVSGSSEEPDGDEEEESSGDDSADVQGPPPYA